MDDLISRQAAIDAIKTIKREIWGVDIPNPGGCPEYVEHHEQMKKLMLLCDNMINEFDKQTTVELIGWWDVREGYYRCSNCGRGSWWATNYCPNCGSHNCKREEGD